MLVTADFAFVQAEIGASSLPRVGSRRWSGSSSSTEASSARRATWARAAPARRALRARRRRATGLPAQSAGRARRLRVGRRARRRAARAGRSPRRALVRRRRLAARSGGAPEPLGSLTVIEPPATSVAAGDPAVDAFAAGGEELYASGATSDPETFLRRFLAAVGSAFDPSLAAPAGARAGRAGAHGRARALGGGDPARGARGGAVPEARRLRRPPPGVRRDLRRPRARARRRARRAPRLRPHRPAPPGVQRRCSPTSSSGRAAG